MMLGYAVANGGGIRISDAKNIVLMGIGEATNGIINLLTHRDCRPRVRGVVNFVSDNSALRAVATSIVDEYLPDWYHQNSRIFVGSEHAVWQRSKIRRKFGTLIKSTANNIHEILRGEMETAIEFVGEQLAR